jgi:hypothetical protein
MAVTSFPKTVFTLVAFSRRDVMNIKVMERWASDAMLLKNKILSTSFNRHKAYSVVESVSLLAY